MSKIILRFAVMSDIHYNAEYPENRGRFKRAMETVYAYAEKQMYRNLDALYVVGDFTDLGLPSQFDMFKEDCDKYVAPETKLVITLANHELHYHSDVGALQKFDELFKMEPDRHEIIGGYHFISLSTCKYRGPWHDSFDEGKRDFLRCALAAAHRESKGKPIFVFQHPGIASTVEGGFFGNSELVSIIKNYPEVIDFSGHSHCPLTDPREIDQRLFTAVSTGSLYNIYQYNGKGLYAYTDRRMRSMDDYAHMLVVEVDEESRVYIKRLDVIAGDFFEGDYILEDHGNPAAFKYTKKRANDATAPCFSSDATISVEKSDGAYKVSFSAAKSVGERVKEYYISLSDDGGIFFQSVLASDHPALIQAERVELSLFDIEKEHFTISVRAAGFWDNYSDSICTKI